MSGSKARLPENKKTVPEKSQAFDFSTLSIKGKGVPLNLKINKRARRIILKVDPLSGSIILTSPSRRLVPEALAFARSRADWIASQLQDASGAIAFEDGTIFPFRGQDVQVRHDPRSRRPAEFHEGEDGEPGYLLIGGAASHTNRRVVDWLKLQARQSLSERADFYCAQLGLKRGRITIRDTKTRWGSCSRDGALSFSWRLVLAPSWVLDYVAAHECAHLVHLDHSRKFWTLLEKIDPNSERARIWFDKNGSELFRWGVVPGNS